MFEKLETNEPPNDNKVWGRLTPPNWLRWSMDHRHTWRAGGRKWIWCILSARTQRFRRRKQVPVVIYFMHKLNYTVSKKKTVTPYTLP